MEERQVELLKDMENMENMEENNEMICALFSSIFSISFNYFLPYFP
jgi:hypothetical protein